MPVPSARDAAPPVAHEDALSEIRHELGNFFHKLYYWLDRLDEAHGGPDAIAGQMLEQTVRNLEDFLGTTLEYFGPLAIAPVRMTVPEVLGGLRARIEDVSPLEAGAPLEGDVTGVDGSRALLVDPVRLPEVLDAALRQVLAQVPAGTPVRVRAVDTTHDGGSGLTIELALAGAAARLPAFHSAAATLAWARAQQVAALHGGALREQMTADGGRAVVLFLPYSA